MAWVLKADPSCLLFLLAFVIQSSVVHGTCIVDVCCCKSDSYNASYQTEIDNFQNSPSPPEYEYVGIVPKGDGVFEPCLCADVTVVVTTMKFNDADSLAKAADPAQRPTLESEIETELSNMRSDMNAADETLREMLVSLMASYVRHDSSEVDIKVEFILKGRDEQLKANVETGMAAALGGSSLNPLNAADLAYSVVSCSGDPVASLPNGERTWSGSNLASEEAVYRCNARYHLSSGNAMEVSKCLPSSAEWSQLRSDLTCIPDTDKCSEDPPVAPPFALSSWNNYSKAEGTVVNYDCRDGYSALNDVSTSSFCRSGQWTTLSSQFQCLHTGCLDQPPQVPTFGVLEWHGQKADGFMITYTCASGYKLDTGEDSFKVTCVNKTWTGGPEKWACVDEKTVLLKTADEDDLEDELNYFLVVTIPSVAGLVLLIICCLCCTRTDSPLFNICSVRGPKKAGYSSA